jgi:hypothetical protein
MDSGSMTVVEPRTSHSMSMVRVQCGRVLSIGWPQREQECIRLFIVAPSLPDDLQGCRL